MALREINRYLNVAGCSVYFCPDGSTPEQDPLGIDQEVTLPSVTHPTSDVQLMGTASIPVQTSIEDMECTIRLPDSAAANRCRKKGVVTFLIYHAVSISDCQTGEVNLGGFKAKVSGIISGKEGLNITPQGETSTAITLKVLRYQFVDDEGNQVIDIDRPAGVLKINGEDYRSELKSLL